MDLGAYMKIDSLDSLAERNGIHVDRLRGYRMMKDEHPIVGEEYERIARYILSEEYRRMIEAVPRFSLNPIYYEYSTRVRRLCDKYLIKDEDGYVIDVRWNMLHGKRRKAMKYAKKLAQRKVKAQYDLWNTYCGRRDVLYIHARVGSHNWSATTWQDYSRLPWFLGAVDDSFDESYCDIYARIDMENEHETVSDHTED